MIESDKTFPSKDVRNMEALRRYSNDLMPMVSDAAVYDVVVNSDGKVWVNRAVTGFEMHDSMAPEKVSLILRAVAAIEQVEFSHRYPILETIFPLTGDRIEGLCEPVVDQCALAIRTRRRNVIELVEMERSGVLAEVTRQNYPYTQNAFRNYLTGLTRQIDVIRAACVFRRNILIVGQTGSGKTTLANSVIREWSTITPEDRIVTIEDTPELQCSSPNHVQLVCAGAISQADLLVASMRLIPTRIVVGEVREPMAAAALLGAWNTGHSGGLATIHANSAQAGLRKLQNLIGDGDSVAERVAEAIHLAVFIEPDGSLPAGRKVREVAVVCGYDRASRQYQLEYF